ncbi:MAG: peroxiredoxin [Paracoccaceae bacterium]|jgi:peroxiredoxin
MGQTRFGGKTRRRPTTSAEKKVVLFSLPGAFTPTCSTYQLPDFEKLFEEFRAEGVDDIACVSVNDAFVMNAWGKSQNIDNITLIPDGSGEFTRKMGMLVCKDNLGFGMRSWRYAAIIDDGVVPTGSRNPGSKTTAKPTPTANPRRRTFSRT